jgi:hypothetical protein
LREARRCDEVERLLARLRRTTPEQAEAMLAAREADWHGGLG